MTLQEALLAGLPPEAYDRTAPTVQAEAAATAAVLQDALNSTDDVLIEHQPESAAEALADWERNYNLPDACVGGASAPVSLRRLNLLARINGLGDLSRDYMLGLAEMLGYPYSTIIEFGGMTCEDPCDSSVTGEEFIGVWMLRTVLLTGIQTMTCESPCDAQLRSWGNTQLECVIRRHKPAHTIVHFAYDIAGGEMLEFYTEGSGYALHEYLHVTMPSPGYF